MLRWFLRPLAAPRHEHLVAWFGAQAKVLGAAFAGREFWGSVRVCLPPTSKAASVGGAANRPPPESRGRYSLAQAPPRNAR